MLSEQMRTLFSYNTWAWQRVFVSVEKLKTAEYMAERPIFGDSSIHKILVHAMAAEQVWYLRLQGESPAALADPADYADFSALLGVWRNVIHSWANHIQWITDEDCAEVVRYRNTGSEAHTLTRGDILQHVVNHSTEHRSQLTPILFNLGVPTQPLDFIRFRLRR